MAARQDSEAARIAAFFPLKKDRSLELAEAMMDAWLKEQRDSLAYDSSEPHPDKVRKSLKRVSDAATRLVDAIEKIPPRARYQIAEEMVASRLHGLEYARLVAALTDNLEEERFLRQLAADVERLAASAKAGEQARFIGKGRAKKTRILEGIVELGEIFEYLTGIQPSRKVHDWNSADYKKEYGAFFKVVSAALFSLRGKEAGSADRIRVYLQERKAGLTESRWVAAFFDTHPQWGNFNASDG